MKKGFVMIAAVAAMLFTSCKEDASTKVNEENVETAAARDAEAGEFPKLTFDESEYDFGTIEQGTNVEHVFTFKNTGDAPLVITDAKSSCGCTVPTWTKEAIAPGETGEMLVKFNGSGKNQVTKTVTVTANTESGKEMIRIKAFVTPKGESAAATN
ncbi:MAG TPA: DUF1573 domain-containing protein [Salinimicrobium sp.]|nr:DUF1573 domain-containing protein [Salinimicrobium sp.]